MYLEESRKFSLPLLTNCPGNSVIVICLPHYFERRRFLVQFESPVNLNFELNLISWIFRKKSLHQWLMVWISIVDKLLTSNPSNVNQSWSPRVKEKLYFAASKETWNISDEKQGCPWKITTGFFKPQTEPQQNLKSNLTAAGFDTNIIPPPTLPHHPTRSSIAGMEINKPM